MQPRRIVLNRYTLTDIKDAIARMNLDAGEFVEKTRVLTGEHACATDDDDTALLRGLVQVELPHMASSRVELLAPYDAVGVPLRGWGGLISLLRIRNAEGSGLVDVNGLPRGADYAEETYRREYTIRRDRLHFDVRFFPSSARTLAADLGYLDPIEERPWRSDFALDDGGDSGLQDIGGLVETIFQRIRPSIGGALFVGQWGWAGALMVLQATVLAVLRHPVFVANDGTCAFHTYYHTLYALFSSYDAHPKVHPKRKRAKPGALDNLAVARRILEIGHPRGFRLKGPWPTNPVTHVRDVACVEVHGDRVVIPSAAGSAQAVMTPYEVASNLRQVACLGIPLPVF